MTCFCGELLAFILVGNNYCGIPASFRASSADVTLAFTENLATVSSAQAILCSVAQRTQPTAAAVVSMALILA